jgi:hypothetical protein
MRNVFALALIRIAAGLIATAARIALRPLPDAPPEYDDDPSLGWELDRLRGVVS